MPQPSALTRLIKGNRIGSAGAGTSPALQVQIGSVHLPNPVMCASGTAGHGAELGAYFDLDAVGAIVVKSLSAEPWQGNPAPRVTHTPAGMINAVGLQGPGVEAWIDEHLDELTASRARVVASIWGRSVDEYAQAAQALAPVKDHLIALEVNISCPNLEDRSRMFAHSTTATTEAIDAAAVAGLPRWAKLSPNIGDLVPIADAAASAGAEAVTVANTMIGLVIDTAKRRPHLGNGKGGLSGPAIRPIAVRAVWDIHEALPELPIIGVGGIATGDDALQFLMAGATAVQVGTATFADPKSVLRIRDELGDWCAAHSIPNLGDLTGIAHGAKNDG